MSYPRQLACKIRFVKLHRGDIGAAPPNNLTSKPPLEHNKPPNPIQHIIYAKKINCAIMELSLLFIVIMRALIVLEPEVMGLENEAARLNIWGTDFGADSGGLDKLLNGFPEQGRLCLICLWSIGYILMGHFFTNYPHIAAADRELLQRLGAILREIEHKIPELSDYHYGQQKDDREAIKQLKVFNDCLFDLVPALERMAAISTGSKSSLPILPQSSTEGPSPEPCDRLEHSDHPIDITLDGFSQDRVTPAINITGASVPQLSRDSLWLSKDNLLTSTRFQTRCLSEFQIKFASDMPAPRILTFGAELTPSKTQCACLYSRNSPSENTSCAKRRSGKFHTLIEPIQRKPIKPIQRTVCQAC